MFYYGNSDEKLNEDLFSNPTSVYRGAPFWAWNCKIEKDELLRQIDIFKKMGMGGFHMHVRTGMASPYLDEEFMGHISTCIDKAKKENMLAYLYDEDRWPSGTAGGRITKEHPEYIMHNLLFTPYKYGEKPFKKEVNLTGRGGTREENGVLLACYDVVLNEKGELVSYKKIGEDEKAEGTKWYAYDEKATATPWFNGQPYIDTLNKEAVECFAKSTHELYYRNFKEDFGKTLPEIFTDEPQYAVKGTLSFALEKKDVFLPWTPKMPELFKEYTGLDLFEKFPELIWEKANEKVSYFRYKYHDFICELFATAYCKTLGDWCDSHSIMLGGHLMHEDTLSSQTGYCGEAMRCYRYFSKLPGLDLLCDRLLYNTVKQCASSLHQNGGEGVLSELYGVTGWDFDFRGHKLQGDWQAALGVTLRVPHLTWMSMKGEAKRDYPAVIGYQSPWFEKYSIIEDHFARLNTVLTRGKPVVRIAVIHPIESYWLLWGPSEQTAAARDQLENAHKALSDTLLFNTLDFDFISESQLPLQCKEGGNPLKVGQMEYDVIIVPNCTTLRRTTLERLEKFRNQGGQLIFTGKMPEYIDAKESQDAKWLYENSRVITDTRNELVDALEEYRFVDVRVKETYGGIAYSYKSGSRTDDMIHQIRKDGNYYWLFLCHGKKPVSPDVDSKRVIKITLNGEYKVKLYDTMTGKTRDVKACYENGKTVIETSLFMHDSMLYRLEKGRNEGNEEIKMPQKSGKIFHEKVNYSLSEPNALLIDTAYYALDDGEYKGPEEFLRLDNACRIEAGIPIRMKAIKQPYLVEEKPPVHKIRLRYSFDSEIEYKGAMLAIEEPEKAKIVFNGQNVASSKVGWYVDKAIECVMLPDIIKGENTLEIQVPLGERTNLEWCYILGKFGVRVDGCTKTVIKLPEKIAFGDMVTQGLPFYTGNTDYDFEVEVGEDGKLALRTEQYRGALIDVLLDGEYCGNIIFSPYVFEKDGIAPGKHNLTLRLYGTRQNGFAQLHHTQGVYFYQSPDSWRSKDEYWQYEYKFKPQGILKSPEIF